MVGLAISYSYVLIILFVGTKLEQYGKEISRKFVHIMTSNWWFIMMACFRQPFWPIVVSISFVVVNIITYKYGLFTCIERENKVKDKGTIYYALTLMLLVVISFLLEDMTIGLIGTLIMGYADGLAALCGKKIRWRPYYVRGNKKSWSGSIAMFVVSFAIVWVTLKYKGYGYELESALMIGAVATGLEAISTSGWDNLTVPLSIVPIYILMYK